MSQKTCERMTRRRFLRIAASSILTVGLLPAFLQGCAGDSLALLINQYRAQNNLPAIPVSDKLTRVAYSHVEDLDIYHPEVTCGNKGNLHSWSNNGKWQGISGVGAWQGCCYPDDHSNSGCMWNKPKEIAGYPSEGFEITCSGPKMTAQVALASWKTSSLHNDVILNKGVWSSFQWQALGAAYRENHACAWFGEVKD
jgi:hypothetical protein